MAEVSCGAAAYCVSNALVRESHTVVFFTCLSVHLRINVSKLRSCGVCHFQLEDGASVERV